METSMRLQQMTKPQDGALVGWGVFGRVQVSKVAKHGGIVQRALRSQLCNGLVIDP